MNQVREYSEAEWAQIERAAEEMADAGRVWHSQRTHGHQAADAGSTLIMGQRIWSQTLTPVGVRR